MLQRLKIIALLSVLVLCGCNREKVTPAESSVTLALAKTMSPINLMLDVADQQKLWAKEGINIRQQVFPSARQAMDAIATNSADLATASDTPLLIALHRDVPFKLLCTIASSDHHIALVTTGTTEVTCQSMARKRVAISVGTAQQYFLYHFFSRDPADCDITSVNLSPPDALAAFKAGGELNGIVAWEPQLSVAAQVPGAHVAFGAGMREVFGLAYGSTSQAFKPEIRARVKKVLEAAGRWIENNPEGTRDLLTSSQHISAAEAEKLRSRYVFKINEEDQMVGSMASQEDWAKGKNYIHEIFGKAELKRRVEP